MGVKMSQKDEIITTSGGAEHQHNSLWSWAMAANPINLQIHYRDQRSDLETLGIPCNALLIVRQS